MKTKIITVLLLTFGLVTAAQANSCKLGTECKITGSGYLQVHVTAKDGKRYVCVSRALENDKHFELVFTAGKDFMFPAQRVSADTTPVTAKIVGEFMNPKDPKDPGVIHIKNVSSTKGETACYALAP